MKILAKLTILAALAAPAIASAQPAGDGDQDSDKGGDRRAEMLKKYDTNGDGKLDDNEKAAMRAAMIDERFAQLDTNKDGSISKDEFVAGMKDFRGGHHGWKHGKHGKRHNRDGKDARRGKLGKKTLRARSA